MESGPLGLESSTCWKPLLGWRGWAGPGARLPSWLVLCPEVGRDRAGATHARGDSHASTPGPLCPWVPQVGPVPGHTGGD